MKQESLSVEKWHELSNDQKEIIRKWAVKKGYGLEIVHNATATTCDYAALLTQDKMKLLLGDLGAGIEDKTESILTVWERVKRQL